MLIINLNDVKFVPDLRVNLFSIGKTLKSGFKFGNNCRMIKVMKGNVTILFNRFVATKNGFDPGIQMMTLLNDVSAAVAESKEGKFEQTN